MKNICDIYQDAMELHQQGINVISTDEKTGIQAIERKITPMKPGQVERQESEYIRHGTQCLISNARSSNRKNHCTIDKYNSYRSRFFSTYSRNSKKR